MTHRWKKPSKPSVKKTPMIGSITFREGPLMGRSIKQAPHSHGSTLRFNLCGATGRYIEGRWMEG